jgi:hypothetical protein
VVLGMLNNESGWGGARPSLSYKINCVILFYLNYVIEK